MRRIIGAGALALLAGCATQPVEPEAAARTIYFGFDRETLTAEAIAKLSHFQDDAARLGAASVAVVAHADTVAGEEVNAALSARRARTIRQDLIARGVPAAEIAALGVGEAALAVETGDGVMAPRNRFATVALDGLSARPPADRETPYAFPLPPELPPAAQPFSALDAEAEEAS